MSNTAKVDTIDLIKASDIIPESINWLWKGWLAAGKMHIIGGAPGEGKTTICLSLAAILSSGGIWPDGSKAKAGNVVIWSGEDDPKDTLVPRLMASSADCNRVHFINGILNGNERRMFDPAKDIEPLRRKLAEIGNVRLLIIDPIVSAVSGILIKTPKLEKGCNLLLI
ncbi:MAG: AAA family ATPase [Deltaproteobacteria bacterium]|nr:AAA family ATPase [Deltaproteobacteria bacterium]